MHPKCIRNFVLFLVEVLKSGCFGVELEYFDVMDVIRSSRHVA
jgi:hypothetical protein